MRGRFRHAQRIALEAIDAQGESRAWKLFGLLSGVIERRDLEDRAHAFAQGNWLPFLESAKQVAREASLR